jgi:hypothetical protein
MITNQTRRAYFAISGTVPSTFAFDFWYYIASEFFAVLTLADGTEITLINGTDYTLTAPAEGGTLTRVTDWETLYPTAISLTLYRLTPRTQQTDFANGSKADAEVHEATHDHVVAMLQEAYDDSTRAPLHPLTDPDGLSYAIPAVSARALQYLSWDEDGNIIASPGTAAAGTADAALLNGRPSGHLVNQIPISDDAINSHLYAGRAALADVAAFGQNYDIIIDSNAKLDLWAQCVDGSMKRVLIRSGTWTASALSPTAGVLIDLDAAGTVYVFAEPGSAVVYSGAYAGNLYGLYHASLATDMSLERFVGINISITNTETNQRGVGFSSCTNLTNCTGTGTGTGAAPGYGFSSCTNLTNCIGTGTGIPGYGFSSCTNLTNCTGTGTGTGATGSGFDSCAVVMGCSGAGYSSGFSGRGFSACVCIIGCAGVGIGTTGYGFHGCKKMQQNKPLSASTTATYNTSYADAGTSNACADTAAGGYNS